MCTATNSAIPTAPIREEWHTRLTTPRRVGVGGHAGCEQSHAPPARRRRARHPVPEVALGATRGRVAPPLTLQFRPCRCVRSGRLDSQYHCTSAQGGPRGSSRRVRRLPGGGAPCTQYQRSHGFHCASVGLLENPRRGGSGGHADSEQTHEPRVRRSRLYRSQILRL